MFTRSESLPERRKPGDLAGFLRSRRKQIPAETTHLGRTRRLPARIGRPVTQEELAEAIGVSRTWYARLENPGAPRTSLRLLLRIADALTLDRRARARLFTFAFDEIEESA
jgi:DNA-binding XRE family transcriptional regulator